MTTNVKVEDLVLEFKRSGRFDEIRKQLLDEFSSSPSGQQLYTSLCRLASETETSSKPGLIGALGKSALFNNTSRNQIGQELLISPKFREKVEGQLKSTFYELKKSAPPAAVSTAPAPTVAKDPEPKVIEAKEEINVDLFLAEIEMSNAMSAGMALNSKKLKLKKAQASTTKSPQILPSEPAPETSTQAEAEADTEMSVELPPVTVASAESQQPGEEMQLDEISEAQNIDSSIDPASYRSVNIEQDSSKLTEAEPPVVTPTKSIEADDSGKNDSKSTGKEGKSRFKVGEEYACLIPGDTVRYFNVILRTADLIKNEFIVEECLDDDQEDILSQTWTVKQEDIIHFLRSVMFRMIKVDDDIWVLSQKDADGPVATEFCQAKVVKKNKASARVIYPDEETELIPKARMFKLGVRD